MIYRNRRLEDVDVPNDEDIYIESDLGMVTLRQLSEEGDQDLIVIVDPNDVSRLIKELVLAGKDAFKDFNIDQA